MSTQSLAWILGLALVAALLAITGWLTMLACVILTLVQYQIVGWEWALAIAGGVRCVMPFATPTGRLPFPVRANSAATPAASSTRAPGSGIALTHTGRVDLDCGILLTICLLARQKAKSPGF
jgi:hypothetical protein